MPDTDKPIRLAHRIVPNAHVIYKIDENILTLLRQKLLSSEMRCNNEKKCNQAKYP
jgi:hypothetical protein